MCHFSSVGRKEKLRLLKGQNGMKKMSCRKSHAKDVYYSKKYRIPFRKKSEMPARRRASLQRKPDDSLFAERQTEDFHKEGGKLWFGLSLRK